MNNPCVPLHPSISILDVVTREQLVVDACGEFDTPQVCSAMRYLSQHRSVTTVQTLDLAKRPSYLPAAVARASRF